MNAGVYYGWNLARASYIQVINKYAVVCVRVDWHWTLDASPFPGRCAAHFQFSFDLVNIGTLQLVFPAESWKRRRDPETKKAVQTLVETLYYNVPRSNASIVSSDHWQRTGERKSGLRTSQRVAERKQKEQIMQFDIQQGRCFELSNYEQTIETIGLVE